MVMLETLSLLARFWFLNFIVMDGYHRLIKFTHVYLSYMNMQAFEGALDGYKQAS